MQNITARSWSFFILTSSLLLAVFLTAFTAPEAAPIKFELLHTVEVDSEFMTADHLRASYLISEEGNVSKYDTTGQKIAQYTENRYGQPTFIDATSPFNTLVLYPEMATIVSLDNRLNVRNLFRFSSLGINRVPAACLSSDNYVWFFDQEEYKVKKITTKYDIVYESTEVDLLLGADINPNYMVESGRFLYVNDPDLGVILFDLYGNYYTSFAVPGLESFQVINDNLVFVQDDKLIVYDYVHNDSRELPLPNNGKGIKSLHLGKDRLYILTDTELQIYASRQ